MPTTERSDTEQYERLMAAAAAAETDPTLTADDTRDLAAVAAASDALGAADTALRTAVDTARSNGRSWASIGTALGVSRQAAFQRFGRD